MDVQAVCDCVGLLYPMLSLPHYPCRLDDGRLVLNLPFLDMSNDNLQVIVSEDDGRYSADDGGNTLADLAMLGIDPKAPLYAKAIKHVLDGEFDVQDGRLVRIVRLDGEALTVTTPNLTSFPRCLFSLVSAMIKIDALRLTAGWVK